MSAVLRAGRHPGIAKGAVRSCRCPTRGTWSKSGRLEKTRRQGIGDWSRVPLSMNLATAACRHQPHEFEINKVLCMPFARKVSAQSASQPMRTASTKGGVNGLYIAFLRSVETEHPFLGLFSSRSRRCLAVLRQRHANRSAKAAPYQLQFNLRCEYYHVLKHLW